MKSESMEEMMAMEPEKMFATMQEMMPKMMSKCFSQLTNEQRRKIISMFRGQLDKMETKYLSPTT